MLPLFILISPKQCYIQPQLPKEITYLKCAGHDRVLLPNSILHLMQSVNKLCLNVKYLCSLLKKKKTLSKTFTLTFINPLSGRLISLEDAAHIFLVCLSLCVQPHIKIPGSARYHGVSSLLSAHFSLADFSCGFFILIFCSVCHFYFLLTFCFFQPYHLNPIPIKRRKKPLRK